MSNEKITITLLHPTDSEESLTAMVTLNATPAYLIQQMVQSEFIAAPSRAGQYTLSNVQTGQNLLHNVSLGAAGIGDGATLAVHHETSGAASAGRR